MASSTQYVPHSGQTRQHYERFLRDMRRWLPPGLDDSIISIAEETLSIICRPDIQAALPQLRKQLENLFDTSLTAETLHEIMQYGRLIDDFVVADSDGAGPAAAQSDRGGHMDGLGSILFQDEEAAAVGSSASSASSTNGEAIGAGARENDRRGLMKFAADYDDGEDYEGDGGGVGGGGDYDDETAPAGPRVSFEEVACNPSYVRDSLRRLFPSQTLDECDMQAARVLDYVAQPHVDQLTLETQLTAFLGGYDDEDVMEWIGTAAASRWAIAYGMRFASARTPEEKNVVLDEMKAHAHRDRGVERLYQSVTGKEIGGAATRDEEADTAHRPLRRLDLLAYAFKDERTPHLNTRAVVPQGTRRAVFETHDEIALPPSAMYTGNDVLTPLTAFPEWARAAFPGVEQLNPMQSRVFECAFGSDENVLVSAPTGAGKTNVAMMTMLRAVANAKANRQSLRELKMVYVAPMKALVQEVVRTFSSRLEPLGLHVVELSGDSSLNQAQLADAQLIVTTPEKWDVVTRKSIDLGVAALLRLLILDEVHLLHNERGPVLEAIVARTLYQQAHAMRGPDENIRIVGLSATLPNYTDVASFLQVDRQRGLFVFDSSFRPIPLQQTFCAVKKVRGSNHAAVMNLVAYDKALHAAMNNEQSMVFVHSRKDTEYTANFIVRRATEEKRMHHFVRPGSDAEQSLKEAVAAGGATLRMSLQQMLPMGVAVHHAGLSREERSIVEELFAARHVRVLVCTSTLAWGVNLPANQVIIKGTRVFNGAKGETELLSALDVFQMFGRAGRLGFGSNIGRAAVITSPDDLQYYLGVMNNQLPIESQMMRRVVDMINAEIALGHVESIADGVRWLQRTYLYVRMRRTPEVYGTRSSSTDPLFLHHLENIVHTAVDDLRRCQMAEYDANVRRVATTPYGRIASHYYVSAASMAIYLTHLSSMMHDVDLFRLFAMSKEFSHVAVRPEEQSQLQYLLENAPIAVRESRYTPLAKINILLQCYISDMRLQGLPLMSELVYVKDSAQRILRALHEICLVRGYGRTARQILELCLMVIHQQWAVQSPARQMREAVAPKTFAAFIPVLESRRVAWEEVRQWSLEDLAERLSDERRAAAALDCIQRVPYFTLEAAIRPLTRSMLYVDVDITPEFIYSAELHRRTAGELLLTVEHPNGRILHYERVYIPEDALIARETISAPTIVVPLVEPKPAYYYVRCESTNWLGARCTAPVSLLDLRLPDVAPPLLELHDRPAAANANDDEEAREVSVALEPYGLAAAASKLFAFDVFLPAQYDLIEPVMEHTTESLFVAMPPGGGRTVVAELFALQFLRDASNSERSSQRLSNDPNGHGPKLLYLTASEACATRRYHEWRFKFGEGLQQRFVALLRGGDAMCELTELRMQEADMIIATGDGLAPLLRPGHGKGLAGITHIIADHLHLLRAPEGRRVEECLARIIRPTGTGATRPQEGHSSSGLVHPIHSAGLPRLLALSYPLISTAEVGRWLRIPPARQYNFGASHRQLRVRLEAVEQPGARGRREAAAFAVLRLLKREPYASSPCVVFVPTAGDAEEMAKRVLLHCRDFVPELPEHKLRGNEKNKNDHHHHTNVCNTDKDDNESEDVHVVEDRRLALLLSAGVAYMHHGTSELDELSITTCVEHRPARHPVTNAPLPLLLVCSFSSAWRLPASLFATAFICPAERSAAGDPDDDSSSSSSSSGSGDCSVSELLQMCSRALNEAVVYCRAARRWVWSRLLNDPLPLESHVRYPDDFRDALNAAVAEGRATDMPGALRVLQSHYFLFHLRANPHFYGVASRDEIPAYASDFARAVIASLRAAGCVHVTEFASESVVALRPTPRGLSIARGGLTVDSIEAVSTAIAAGAGGAGTESVSGMWRTLSSACAELSPAALGDAARVADKAELRALRTLARALPTAFGVRYVDTDFRGPGLKVQLLIAAHCARVFAWDIDNDKSSSGSDAHFDAMRHSHMYAHAHPFDSHLLAPSGVSMAVSASDIPLLQAIPSTVAARLLCDLRAVLPAALAACRSAALALDSAHWRQSRYLLRLAAHITRRVWSGDAPLMQLPSVQASAGLRTALGEEWTVERLQRAGAEEAFSQLAHALVSRGVVARAAAAEATVHRLRTEAAALPRVIELHAAGAIAPLVAINNNNHNHHDEGEDHLIANNSEDSGMGIEVHVVGHVACAAQPGRWIVACCARPTGGAERLLAMCTVLAARNTVRQSTTTNNNSNNTAGGGLQEGEEEEKEEEKDMWLVEAKLTFSLRELDGEDLDALTVTATVIAEEFLADAEVDVSFAHADAASDE